MNIQLKRDYFGGLASRWDSLPAPPDAPEKVRRFVTQAVPFGARRVVDVGAGTGILLPQLLELRPGIEMVLELDFAEPMLCAGRAKFGNPLIHHICADAAHPPLRDAGCDAALCFNVLPHFADIATACGSLLACVRPGGTLTVGHMMCSAELNSFHAMLDGPVASDKLPEASALAETLRTLGAEPVAVQEEPGWYFVMAVKGRK